MIIEKKTIQVLVAAFILSAIGLGVAHAAATPEQKCQQAKLKAQGRYKSCIAKSRSSVIGGKADVSAVCLDKFNVALTKADEKAAKKATSCRYIDNGDLTVADLNTGLVWEKKDDSGGIHDKDNVYSWSTASPPGSTGTAFTTFLYGLNGGTSSDGTSTTGCFIGHCDWRVPTIEELQGILLQPYLCLTIPCIDPVFGPTQSIFHWSASTVASDVNEAWGVDFADGELIENFKTNHAFVRAVRGGL